MLKITSIDNDQRCTLILEGTLVEPWVSELERSWAEAQRETAGILVDLQDVTAISEGGKLLLSQMMTHGATLRCRRGVLTKQVVRQLERQRGTQHRKGKHQQ